MQFGILGPLLIHAEERTVWVPAAKQRVLLARLLTRPNQVVPADSLADVVWNGEPPADAQGTLRAYVMRLRKALGPEAGGRIRTRYPGYLIEVADGELDLLRFRSLADAGRAAAQAADWPRAAGLLTEALALWRGSPLMDVPSQALQLAEAPPLEELRLAVAEQRNEAGLRLGEHGELVTGMRAMVAGNPLRERFHAQLMLALYRCGRPAEALAAYQDARKVLVGELGVEPGAELRTLQQRVLAADPGLLSDPAPAAGPASDPAPAGGPASCPGPAGGPAQLPRDIPDFVGRGIEYTILVQELSVPLAGPEPLPVAYAITGMGGIGKTALAVRIGQHVGRAYPDGQLYANLKGTSERPLDPSAVLGRLLRDLGTAQTAIPADPDERAGLFRSLLADRRILLLLDDARDAAQVRPLIPGAAGCAVLVTSRNLLAGLEGLRRVDLTALNPEESRILFEDIIGPSRAAASPADSEEILAVCAGLPLAIRIAAGRLAARPGWTLRTLADRLAAAPPLDELVAGDRAIRTCFAASYAALAESSCAQEKAMARAFTSLGLWDGPDIGIHAAGALLNIPAADAERALESLVNVSLLESPSAGRYRLHDLLRVYAGEQTRARLTAIEQERAITRVASWYLGTAANAADHLNHLWKVAWRHKADGVVPAATFRDSAEGLAWFNAECAAMVALVHQAADRHLDVIAAELPLAMGIYLHLRARWDEWAEVIRVGLSSARAAGVRPLEARLHAALALAHCSTGALEESLTESERALAIARDIDDRFVQGSALSRMGQVLHYLGRLDMADDCHQQSLAISTELGNWSGVAAGCNNIGMLRSDQGRYGEALDYLDQALVLFREVNFKAGEAATLGSIGDLCHRQGWTGRAREAFRDALAICVEITDRAHEAACNDWLGRLASEEGQLAEARGYWSRALAIMEEIRDPAAEGVRQRIAGLARADVTVPGADVTVPGGALSSG